MQCNVISVGPNHATLTCYLQDPSTAMPNTEIRPAALIFPGGGYQYCSDREAEPVALAYLAEGYNAFVLPAGQGFAGRPGSPAPSAGKCGPVPYRPG